MKKIIILALMLLSVQTAVFADAETDMHQAYIAKIQAQDIKYNTYNFFKAINEGNVQLVDLFLKSGMSAESTFMKTPAIYMAIASNQNEIVQLLLENKVDPNKATAGITPLVMAIRQKDCKIVETLISYGADVNQVSGNIKPLSYAIKKKEPKIVELLINAGAKPDNEVLLNALKSDDNYIKDTVLKRYKTME